MPVKLHFEAPYFINRICNNHHKGSIAMNDNKEIFVRDVLELQKTSSQRTFGFKCSGDFLREGFGIPPANPGQWMVSHLLSFLTEIHVRNYHLPKIPVHLLTSQSIHELHLNSVGLECVPESISALPLLTALSLTSNNLTSVSSTLRTLKRLTYLSVENNLRLRSLNPISGHSSLTNLIVRNCAIERLPYDLPQLANLYLSSNNLTDLDSIETLGSGNYRAKSFHFDRNHIQSVTKKISSVKNLTVVNLDYNQLVELPTEVLDIPSLFSLHIEYNRFHPDTLSQTVKALREAYPRLKLKYEKQAV